MFKFRQYEQRKEEEIRLRYQLLDELILFI